MQHRSTMTILRAASAAALLCIPALAGCGGAVADPVPKTRVFTVLSADQQALPAHHECPAPEPGMSAGTRFVEGELTLYGEGSYRWRYLIEQYTTRGSQQVTVERPFTISGTYTIRGETLELRPLGSAAVKTAWLAGSSVELTEAIPCEYQDPAAPVHEAELYLAPLT